MDRFYILPLNPLEVLKHMPLKLQVVIWDIEEYIDKLRSKICIWNHLVILQQQTDKLHIHVWIIYEQILYCKLLV